METTTQNKEIEEQFGEMLYAYSRAQAIADGVLIDASAQGSPFADVSRQHFKYPIAMTGMVYELLKTAVENKKHCNDFAGIWHDMLYMSKVCPIKQTENTSWFKCIITGTHRRTHTFKFVCGPGDNAEPVLTMLFPEED